MESYGHGGARPNSGPKPSGYVKPPEGVAIDAARARHETAKAGLAELKLLVEQGAYLPREPIRQAAATALAMLTQALRSVPDNIERVYPGMPPEALETIAEQIDAALAGLAEQFKLMAPEQPLG